MPDIVSVKKRSLIMSAIRGTNTRPVDLFIGNGVSVLDGDTLEVLPVRIDDRSKKY